MRRLGFAAFLWIAMTACASPGVNAGEEGGVAFIIFAVMLVITYAVLWFIIGRED